MVRARNDDKSSVRMSTNHLQEDDRRTRERETACHDHPIVTEITRRMEPVIHDTFGDPRPVLRPSWPAPKRRPLDA